MLKSTWKSSNENQNEENIIWNTHSIKISLLYQLLIQQN